MTYFENLNYYRIVSSYYKACASHVNLWHGFCLMWNIYIMRFARPCRFSAML